MKNQMWVWVVVVVIVLGGAYMYRHQLKVMLTGAPAPVEQTTTGTPSTAMAPSDNIYKTMTDATKGAYLTDFQGMTLYTFDKDTAGVSNCSGSCITLWPPYTSGATAQVTMPANITVITRTDGSKQFAWNGMPLYYYSKDTKAGDVTGDGVGGVWHLVKP
jgi:predicted lipoprotein with Yx(FWY)xxD motif